MTKWKVFCWLLVVATIGGIVFNISQGQFNGQLVISSIVSVLLLIPYFGYAYQKKIAALLIWKVTFVLQSILIICLALFSVIGQYFYIAGGGDVFGGLLKIITILPIAFVILIPPYLYAFKSAPLWVENV
ncbi:MAG: hypothetical protein ACJAS1_004161 [Oleiphilaceae bacterium]|jgi:hypothetical protein